MRKIREVLRLKYQHQASVRKIAESCQISRFTVAEYLRRAILADLSWPLSPEVNDESLEQLLFPVTPSNTRDERPLPDWEYIQNELRRKGVTRYLLWQEYKASNPEGVGYSQFCDRYRIWHGSRDLVMRQNHKAGEKMFVDYAGQQVPITNRGNGEEQFAEIFVATLGASSYTFCEATWSQTLPDWISSHVHTFDFFGGVPEVLVPDNLKSGVSSPHLYEPELNPTYQDMAVHYGVAVIPARAGHPKDKAKVESAVQIAERWILARLRNQKFFNLSELNQAIGKLLPELNNRPFQKLSGCRMSLFVDIEKGALKPLPAEPYQYAEWKKVRVHIDYHVQIEKYYYSVPYQLVNQQLDVRMTTHTIEIFRKGKRVASHQRIRSKGGFSTITEHMPKKHQHYAKWTPERLIQWAHETGEQTALLIERVLTSRPHPQQAFRSCLGIMNLGKSYDNERLEAACKRALALNAIGYVSLKSILKNGLENQPIPEHHHREVELIIDHENIRGSNYYTESNTKGVSLCSTIQQ